MLRLKCTSRYRTAIWLLGSLWLVGCGGGSTMQNFGAVTIELTATAPDPRGGDFASPVIVPGGTVTVTANVIEPTDNGVTWMIDPPNFGALGSVTPNSLTYTAPNQFSASLKVTITATSVTNPSVTASLVIPTAPLATVLGFPNPQGFDIPASDQTVNPTDVLSVDATVSNTADQNVNWAVSPSVGSLNVVQTPLISIATYTAPAAVSSPTTVTITGTAQADSSAVSSFRITVLPSGAGPDVAVIHVDGGPVPGQTYPNAAFINGVTICKPGTTVCQTVDGLLVDTGSTGLRILQSALPSLQLPTLVNLDGSTLENCYAFADGSFAWGAVSKADLYIAGEAASSYTSAAGTVGNPLLIQVISPSNKGIPDGCSGANPDLNVSGGMDLSTAQLLGANGILGVGLEPTDCAVAGVNYCNGVSPPVAPNVYYACPKGSCQPTDSPVLVPAAQQVTNPVTLMVSNDFTGTISGNHPGVIVNLPAVSGAESSIIGTLTFAYSLPGATIHTVDSNDQLTTLLNGQPLPGFLDSGANALYFPGSLPLCSINTQFFCPSSQTQFSATNQGATQGLSTINFNVDNADNLFLQYPGFGALSTLAGPDTTGTCSGGTGTCTFEWGLPFFYGRPVFTKIDQCVLTAGNTTCPPLTGGYWAY